MQHLRLTHPALDFWIDVRLREFDGRWLAVANLAGEPEVGSGDEPEEALLGALAPFGFEPARTGMSWYSIHSPIALEYIHMVEGRPPLRPMEDCDLPDRPCRWFIYKDPSTARRIHYERMGFEPPPGAPE